MARRFEVSVVLALSAACTHLDSNGHVCGSAKRIALSQMLPEQLEAMGVSPAFGPEETYRVSVLPSFEEASVARVDARQAVAHGAWGGREVCAASAAPRLVEPRDWDALLKLLDAGRFWDASFEVDNGPPVNDGTSWLLEGYRGGQFRSRSLRGCGAWPGPWGAEGALCKAISRITAMARP
jgi:hypothetical protein